MIDFDKQPKCLICPHCVGWAYPRGQQSCAENMAYQQDGSCMYDAERRAQCKQDAYDDMRDDWEDEEEIDEEEIDDYED